MGSAARVFRLGTEGLRRLRSRLRLRALPGHFAVLARHLRGDLRRFALQIGGRRRRGGVGRRRRCGRSRRRSRSRRAGRGKRCRTQKNGRERGSCENSNHGHSLYWNGLLVSAGRMGKGPICRQPDIHMKLLCGKVAATFPAKTGRAGRLHDCCLYFRGGHPPMRVALRELCA